MRLRDRPDAELHPTQRATNLESSQAGSYLRRMGETSWLRYFRTSLLTGIAGRRRGVLGLVLRRTLYPLMFAAATKPVVAEDVIVRGPRRIRLGRNVMLEQRVLLDAKTSRDNGIEIGSDVLIRTGTLLDTGYEGWIRIGSGTTIGAYCEFRGDGGVVVGDSCLIARGALLVPAEHVSDDPDKPMTAQGIRAATMHVGDDVWIGANAVLTGGITVGRGAIIGANSVVNTDIPPGAVAVGAPARIVRTRPGFEAPE